MQKISIIKVEFEGDTKRIGELHHSSVPPMQWSELQQEIAQRFLLESLAGHQLVVKADRRSELILPVIRGEADWHVVVQNKLAEGRASPLRLQLIGQVDVNRPSPVLHTAHPRCRRASEDIFAVKFANAAPHCNKFFVTKSEKAFSKDFVLRKFARLRNKLAFLNSLAPSMEAERAERVVVRISLIESKLAALTAKYPDLAEQKQEEAESTEDQAFHGRRRHWRRFHARHSDSSSDSSSSSSDSDSSSSSSSSSDEEFPHGHRRHFYGRRQNLKERKERLTAKLAKIDSMIEEGSELGQAERYKFWRTRIQHRLDKMSQQRPEVLPAEPPKVVVPPAPQQQQTTPFFLPPAFVVPPHYRFARPVDMPEIPAFSAPRVFTPTIRCDGCNATITQEEVRFKCADCPNFDLCASCEQKELHIPSHALLKLRPQAQKAHPWLPIHRTILSLNDESSSHPGPHHHGPHHGRPHRGPHHGPHHHGPHHGPHRGRPQRFVPLPSFHDF